MSNETEAGRQEARLEPLVGREHLPALVDAFLAWPLPDSVCSDGCVTERGAPHRTGTNLLTADEARQMFEHALSAAGLLGPKCAACNDTGWNHGAQPGGPQRLRGRRVLDKKDTKIYLDPAVHELFTALADSKGLTNSQLASRIVTRAVIEEAHAATVIAEIAKRVGIDRIRAGLVRESSGFCGNGEDA